MGGVPCSADTFEAKRALWSIIGRFPRDPGEIASEYAVIQDVMKARYLSVLTET
jgi:hypothetical protein